MIQGQTGRDLDKQSCVLITNSLCYIVLWKNIKNVLSVQNDLHRVALPCLPLSLYQLLHLPLHKDFYSNTNTLNTVHTHTQVNSELYARTPTYTLLYTCTVVTCTHYQTVHVYTQALAARLPAQKLPKITILYKKPEIYFLHALTSSPTEHAQKH